MMLGQVALRMRAITFSGLAAFPEFGNRVLGTVEFALARENTLILETAFIIPLSEADQGDNRYDTSVNQMVNERFGVVVAIANDAAITDKLGLGAFDRLYSIRQRLFRCFLGWRPPGTEMPMYYKGGQLLDINSAWLWYQFSFQMETHITNSADGVDQDLGPWDDFLRVYTQWLTGDESQAILPMTGSPPVLPETMQPPDMTTVIDYGYGFDRGFNEGFDTLEAKADT